VNGFQNVIVTGFPLYWAGALPLVAPELLLPQAATASAERAAANTAVLRRI
jgi:hypothetical protein